MTADDDLALVASKLSRAAPATWDEFILAMAAYSNAVKDQCVQSELPTLPVAQGRAQQTERMLKLFRTCRDTADRIVGSRNQQGRKP